MGRFPVLSVRLTAEKAARRKKRRDDCGDFQSKRSRRSRPTPTISCHTLGCKVNQYDTQAMLELFQQAGYTYVPWQDDADIYLLNTCTVTGTGDRKSEQAARRVRREHPGSLLIVCGCLAQRESERMLEIGANVVLGTQNRSRVVALAAEALSSGRPVRAVTPLSDSIPFESLTVHRQTGHTRAVMKIQEGCDHVCTYCIIPAVRGPVRSRPLDEIRAEAARFRDAGYREIVLTGIHLASYGKDTARQDADEHSGLTLLDAIQAVQDTDGILRIRLGSLEPSVATEAFAQRLSLMDKVCPQFHLALQSGSDTVLRRMKRRYNTSQYLASAQCLRNVFPHAAFTTDILTGFPGETEPEYQETRDFISRMGFARIHVFPYSQRTGTPAANMPDQIPDALREERARRLIALGHEVSRNYLSSWSGLESTVLPEEKTNGCWEGYTPEYIRVTLPRGFECVSGQPLRVRLADITTDGMTAVPV